MKNIVLIGFMGVGKTTVGRRVSAALKIDFYDTDEYIKKCEKMPVHEILQKKGPTYFEGAQRFAVSTLAQNEGTLISTGGDTVMDPFNLATLKENGILVWLKASGETIFKNTRNSATKRPGLYRATKEEIDSMIQEREPYYQKADIVIDVDHCEIDEAAQEIVRRFKELQSTQEC